VPCAGPSRSSTAEVTEPPRLPRALKPADDPFGLAQSLVVIWRAAPVAWGLEALLTLPSGRQCRYSSRSLGRGACDACPGASVLKVTGAVLAGLSAPERTLPGSSQASAPPSWAVRRACHHPSVMAGLDPAIYANTNLVAFAWMLGSSPSMTVVVRPGRTERQAGRTVVVRAPLRASYLSGGTTSWPGPTGHPREHQPRRVRVDTRHKAGHDGGGWPGMTKRQAAMTACGSEHDGGGSGTSSGEGCPIFQEALRHGRA
jgi:hypothetical protein